MSLLSCQSVAKSFGVRPLFKDLSLSIAEGDRLGLIGPNGSGKSTLLQLLTGVQSPDAGVVTWRKNLRMGYVPQETTFVEGETVRSVALRALEERKSPAPDPESQLNVILGKVGFSDFDLQAATLSGGWRKRLAIARELLFDPEVLLLDEPTNHLDLDGILWLERLLAGSSFASVVVSHDRYFLENYSTDVAEINPIYPSGLFRVGGSYSEFLLKREEFRQSQAQQRDSLQNRVRTEVEWLRRGPKARTTKSKARIDSAGRMIDELKQMQTAAVERSAGINFSALGRKTKKLIVAAGLEITLGGRQLFKDVSFALTPGTRLGLVGSNGSGKTTLLRILAGQLNADGGALERAEALRVVYFDQHREELDPNISLKEALCPHGDSVIFDGRPVHVASWASRFLFRNEQLAMTAGKLSGGERARVAIARLMLQPADLLLLDEPTNDLDIPTLEVLEDNLLEFPGALVLVTHDRYLLDRISTSVLGLGAGQGMYADYSQWAQARQQADAEARTAGKFQVSNATRPASTTQQKRLSYMESREWETMEERIHTAEAVLTTAQTALHDPVIASDPSTMKAAWDRVQEAQRTVDELYDRWAQLEAKQA